MGEPTVDELIRHLQSELGQADDIIDSLDRKRRQLQIETCIQEVLSFQQRYKILDDAGIDNKDNRSSAIDSYRQV